MLQGALIGLALIQSTAATHSNASACAGAYNNVNRCASGLQGSKQADWATMVSEDCKGPADGYSTLQWTSLDGMASDAIGKRNGGSLISPRNQIPRTLDELRCWFLPDFSWGMQRINSKSPAPPWNPQPEAAYLDDAGNGLGGGLPGPDSTVNCCCQEECTMEMIELRHWINYRGKNADINYNTDGNNGRVLLTRTADRGGALKTTKHEACMCGDRTRQHQEPFYYYVVQGPATSNTNSKLQWWLNSLRTAYNNLFDVWAQNPPCSGECLIMGGASDSWVTYGHSTARSVYFQLRAFAAFDPQALPNACGQKGVMLRFGGMTLDGATATCYGNDWGETGAHCPTVTNMASDFHSMVTQSDDNTFFSQAGAPSTMTIETDRAVATITFGEGVTVKKKLGSCGQQPILNHAWRCGGVGGISDEGACLSGSPPSPPGPTPAPTPTPPGPSPGATCNVGDSVRCPGTTANCAGNQCCSDGSTCNSAASSFHGCSKPKSHDCTQALEKVMVV